MGGGRRGGRLRIGPAEDARGKGRLHSRRRAVRWAVKKMMEAVGARGSGWQRPYKADCRLRIPAPQGPHPDQIRAGGRAAEWS